MKKLLYIFIGLMIAGSVNAAPITSFQPTLLPISDNLYDLGTSTKYWRDLYVNEICLAGDCKTAWPVGGEGSSFAWPFTVNSWGNSTTSTLGFLNGFLSTASSTQSGNFFLPALSQGFSYIGSNGKVNSIASSSVQLSWFNNDSGFVQNTRTITVAGTANQVTSSAGAQDLSANRTWTLSFPNQVIFPGYASSTSGFSTPYASSTDLRAGTFTFGGVTGSAWTDFCTSITGSADLCDGNDASGAGGSTAYEIATTSDIAVPNLAYFTKTGGRTTLGSVATSTLSATSPLTGSFVQVGTGGSLGCQTASGSQAGCLASADWTTFNNKESALTFTWPLIRSTNTITFGGLSTSSSPTTGHIPYWTEVNTFGSVATGTISVPTGLTATAGRYVIGGNLTLGLDTGYVIPLQSTLDAKALGATTLTVAGTANQITSSAGAQDLSANRTWTLSFPNTVIFPGYASSTSGFSTPYASSTLYYGANLTSCNGATNALTWSAGVFGCNTIAAGLSSYDAWTHPSSGISATTSEIRMAGFVSTASSTVSGLFRAVATGLGKAPSASIRNEILTDGTYTQGTRTEGDVATRLAFSGFVTGDSQVRYTTRVDGLTAWGSGSAVTDTNLYRGSAFTLTTDKYLTVGTTTANYPLVIASTTASQIGLSAGTGIAQWALRNAGGNLYFATTTVAGTATTSTAALTLSGSGKPGLAISSSTPWATLAVNPLTGDYSNAFVIGSSTATRFVVNNSGYVGIATSTPYWPLSVVGTTVVKGQAVSLTASTTAGTSLTGYTVDWSSSNTHRITLTGNATLVINATSSNPIDGGKYILKLCQDGTGSRTVTFVTPGQLSWHNGTTTATTTANTATVIGFIYDGREQKYNAIASTTIKCTP